jgi:phage major head subunit gpT-like protein
MQLLLEVFAYRNWQRAPERIVLAEEQFRHTNMAAVLDGSGTRSVTSTGPTNTAGGLGTLCVDGQAFFSATHPVNMTDSTVTFSPQYSAPGSPITQWSNYQSTATNVLGSTVTGNSGGAFNLDNLVQEVVNMQTAVPDENGILLGVDPDTILVPQDYYEPLKNGLMNDRLAQLVTNATSNDVAIGVIDNLYKGRFKIEPVKEFTLANTSTADWYLVDSKLAKRAEAPWVIAKQNVAQSLALRMYDESTDFFRDTGHIKVSAHIWYGFALALPHGIRRIKGPTRTANGAGT